MQMWYSEKNCTACSTWWWCLQKIAVPVALFPGNANFPPDASLSDVASERKGPVSVSEWSSPAATPTARAKRESPRQRPINAEYPSRYQFGIDTPSVCNSIAAEVYTKES